MFNGETWEALSLKSREEANAQWYLTLFSKQSLTQLNKINKPKA